MKKRIIDFIKRPMGIRNRLFLQTVSVAVFFFVVTLLLSNAFTEKAFIAIAKDNMLEVAQTISTFEIKKGKYEKALAQIETTRNIYIEIYRYPAQLIYSTRSNNTLYSLDEEDSIEQEEPKEKLLKTISMPSFLDDDSFFAKAQEVNSNAKYIMYSTTFGAEQYALKLCDSLDVIESNAELTKKFIMFLALLIWIFIIIIIAILENLYTRPIIEINKVTKKLSDIDFSEKCPQFRPKELNELSSNINRMSSALDMSLSDLREKNLQLEQDIEKDKALDKIKTEFIANASHELKTPIAIIQGYAEGLKLGIAQGDYAEEYCDIIMEESVKMNNLVIKLMEIGKYESGAYKLKLTSFNLLYAANSLLKPRIKLLKEDGITLCININPSYKAYADIYTTDNIVNNFVSNAISHVNKNGLILVNATDIGDKYRISVFNTGSQVNENDNDKIWTSFYRADKSRSRASGRFGLGLSFVKSIQELYKNKYGVINRDNGVEFWFDIDKFGGEE